MTKKQIFLLNIGLLLFSTGIWGYGFIATRWTLEGLDPYWSNSLRFGLAGLLSLPILLAKKSFTRKNHILKQSFISSLFLLGILLFQTIGLSLTTVAKSGFITTLYSRYYDDCIWKKVSHQFLVSHIVGHDWDGPYV